MIKRDRELLSVPFLYEKPKKLSFSLLLFSFSCVTMKLLKRGKGKQVQDLHEPVAVNGVFGSFSVPYRKRDVATALLRGKVEKQALP